MKWEEPLIMQYLADIYRSALLKDVIQRNGIRDAALLERAALYIMDNIGNIFSANTVSDFLKGQGRKLSAETAYSYIRAEEQPGRARRRGRGAARRGGHGELSKTGIAECE
ncbi:MAG: hypothetical protein LBJ10_03925 [Clostridiales bacterium]|nr:hypothetical protein [Clostridiales bacterium]